jgi:hypothetical protein
MRIFYDCEFHERGSRQPIEFISIGMVNQDGDEYYAINSQVTWWAIYKNVWLRENVLTQLPGTIKNYGNGGGTFEPDDSSGLYLPPAQIAVEVSNFCDPGRKGDKVELWAHYSDYDHVVLAQLFGSMIDLPKHMPMYTRDFQQVTDMLMPGHVWPQQEGTEHNALSDARWLRDRFIDLERALIGSQVGKLVTL